MKVVFCGTPDFAIPSLEALIKASFDVVAVITQPDKPRGRGHKMTPCPVKEYAVKQGLTVHSFNQIRNEEGVGFLKKTDFDVMVTAAYGQILSQEILDIPKYGCVNVHASLLPKYRGPAPIQWAIINGERETGVTSMLTERGVDCGDILMQRKTDILHDENAGQLFDRLAKLGGEVLTETLKMLENNTITPQKQDSGQATHFPMLKKTDGKIDFTKTAQQVKDLIRGVNPWPGAYFNIDGETVKVMSSSVIEKPATGKPATIACCDAKIGLIVNTSDRQILLDEIQFAGKRPMNSKQALCGRTIDISAELS